MAYIVIDLDSGDRDQINDASPIDGWHGSYLHPTRDLFGAQTPNGRLYWPLRAVAQFHVIDSEPEPERKGASATEAFIDEATEYLAAVGIDTTPLREATPEERYAILDVSRMTGPTAERPSSTNTVGVVTGASSEPVVTPISEGQSGLYHLQHHHAQYPDTCIYCLDDTRRPQAGAEHE